jgi:hypothetical protein
MVSLVAYTDGQNTYGPPPDKIVEFVDKLQPARPKPRTSAKSPMASTPEPVTVDQVANKVLDKISSDARFRGPAGPSGVRGPAGRDGRDGHDGARGPVGLAGTIDQRILDDIVRRLKHLDNATFTVEVILPDGTKQTGKTRAAGGKLKLDFSETKN